MHSSILVFSFVWVTEASAVGRGDVCILLGVCGDGLCSGSPGSRLSDVLYADKQTVGKAVRHSETQTVSQERPLSVNRT